MGKRGELAGVGDGTQAIILGGKFFYLLNLFGPWNG